MCRMFLVGVHCALSEQTVAATVDIKICDTNGSPRVNEREREIEHYGEKELEYYGERDSGTQRPTSEAHSSEEGDAQP